MTNLHPVISVNDPATGGMTTGEPGHRLDISHVSKRFDTGRTVVEALSDINVTVEAGEFLSIVGASGCGTSTLLRPILGLDVDYEG